MLEEKMSKAVLETIDAKLSPILERLERLEKESLRKESCLSTRERDAEAFKAEKRGFDDKLTEIDKKFVVTGKLIESVMNAVEKTTRAKKCEADTKGIELLKGEREHAKEEE